AGSLAYLLKAADKPGKGNQVDDFFKQGSVNFIGDLKHLEKTIIGHSYFTTSPDSTAKNLRRSLSDKLNKYPGLSFWQSEYCILGDNAGEINGSKRDLGIDAALYLARVIHTDLSAANASAWQWWTAISRYDYKDGLVYVDNNKTDGNYYASKMLWAMGNYSRFIRPGAVRVDAQVNGDQQLKTPLLISAFKKGHQLIVVVVNNNPTNVPLNIIAGSVKIAKIKVFTTSASANLQAGTANNDTITIQPRSVTTITAAID
ncbi:MAG: glycoside hydrolase, partial [Mucilaginibacter sp.]